MRPQVFLQSLPYFDSLSILQADAYQASFPMHSHEEICLTLVRSGFETTEAYGRKRLTPSGAISITDAGILHANPNDNGGPYDFTTYYLSPDFVQFLSRNSSRPVFLGNQVIHYHLLFEQLSAWPRQNHSAPVLQQLLSLLIEKYRQPQANTQAAEQSDRHFEQVLEYIDQRLGERISLAEIAQIAGLSPFHFSRRFKATQGLSPLQYITLRRVNLAKNMLRSGHTIIATAHSLGFFDQSHFHRFFQRFTGLTPGAFAQNSKIVQDQEQKVE